MEKIRRIYEQFSPNTDTALDRGDKRIRSFYKFTKTANFIANL